MNLLKNLAKKPLSLTVLYHCDKNSLAIDTVKIVSMIFPKVIVALNIQEVLNYLKEHKVDIVLSDFEDSKIDLQYEVENYIQTPENLNSLLDILDKTIEKIEDNRKVD